MTTTTSKAKAMTALESAVALSQAYSSMARLALASGSPDHQRISMAMQTLTEQLSCGSCGSIVAGDPHPDHQGILCAACHVRKSTEEAMEEDEVMAADLLKATVKNIALLVAYLAEEMAADPEAADEVNEGDSDDDPEVSFSPKTVLSMPNHLPVVGPQNAKKKMFERLKTLNSALGNDPLPEIKMAPKVVEEINLHQQQENKASKSKKMMSGCRCGIATLMPGKLTCCGQRCPCYVKSKSCTQCKCRGCRNPHLANGGRKRQFTPSPVKDNDTAAGLKLSPRSKIIITAANNSTAPLHKSQIVLSKLNI